MDRSGLTAGIIGCGSFGTALANALSRNRQIRLIVWDKNPQVLTAIRNNRENPLYFPGVQLHQSIEAADSIHEIWECADVIFLAVPSRAIAEVLKCNLRRTRSKVVVNLAKGLTPEGKLPCDLIIEQVQSSDIVASMKGPSFASELIRNVPTRFTYSTSNSTRVPRFESLFEATCISVEYVEDWKALEWVSILKNIYAIIMGMVDAIWNAANVRHMFLALVVQEIREILLSLNLSTDVLFTSGGIGDITLTGLTDLSRNRTFGLAVGKRFINVPVNYTGAPILEGLESLSILSKKATQMGLVLDKFPLLKGLIDVLEGNTSPYEYLQRWACQ